jgi:hypothetical protein
MPSKTKDVRLEQRRILEKKLDLRLQKLAQKGISQEKAQSDPLVKNLKAKIRETNIRIRVADKFVRRTEELAQAKAQKIADLTKQEEKQQPEAEAVPVEAKPKKRAAAATGEEPKKKAAAPKEPKKKPADAEAPKKPRKKKEESQEG